MFARSRAGAIHLKTSPEDTAEKATLPEPVSIKDHVCETPRQAFRRRLALLLILLPSLYLINSTWGPYFPKPVEPTPSVPSFIEAGLQQCKIISSGRPDLSDFASSREKSNRYVKGTTPTLISNGTVWTGEDNGNEILYGASVLLDNGIIVKVGSDAEVRAAAAEYYGAGLQDFKEVDVAGKWVTPGLVDPHSHLGVDAAPSLSGSADTNSVLAATQPYLRTIDAINPHDEAMPLVMSGGVTTALVLHGSAVPMGAESFLIKLRPTDEFTPESMMVEEGFQTVTSSNTNETFFLRTKAPRYLKQATGENPNRVLHATRQNTGFLLREAYEKGYAIKAKQETWCAKGSANTEPYPTNEWDTLADVLRGDVIVMTHTYEEPDIGMLMRLTNQFKFKIGALHHFHEGYLVIDTLKKFWGGAPTACIFATNARYKREAWWGSEYAPYILDKADVPVSFKSDHPVLDARYLIHEASQGLSYGLPFNKALAAVTTAPAKAVGMSHRLGHLLPGYDADVVVWDSVPLALGATPVQVYIDGIAQLESPFTVEKAGLQTPMAAPDVSKKAAETLKYHGEPPLEPKAKAHNVVFSGVSALYLKDASGTGIQEVQLAGEGKSLKDQTVIIKNGEIVCSGSDCAVTKGIDFEFIDLKGGALTSGLTTYGSNVGLLEIKQESSTSDGTIDDVLTDSAPLLDGLVIRGADGARFGGRDEQIAYANGVTAGVAHPISKGVFSGLSYAFATNGKTALDGVTQEVASMHIALSSSTKTSTSTNIAILRNLLTGETGEHTPFTKLFKKIAAGKIPLVVATDKADIIAQIIKLSKEIGGTAKFVIEGGAESHLLAEELAEADIGVLTVSHSYPHNWDSRRLMKGLPWTEMSLPAYLASKGVTVGLSITEEWMARNTRVDAAWQYISGGGAFSKASALDLVSTNVEKLLGITPSEPGMSSWVAWEGDWTSLHSKVVAVRGEGKPHVDMFN